MGTYIINFDLLIDRGNRTCELINKKEVIMEKNRSFAKLHLLNKYTNKDTKIKFNHIEPLFNKWMGGEVN